MTFGSPFIARFDDEWPAPSRRHARRELNGNDVLFELAQQLGGAFAAAAAAGTDAEGNGEVIDRARTRLCGLADLALGDRVADAEIQGSVSLNENHYHLKTSHLSIC
jgi:hypothetical protein